MSYLEFITGAGDSVTIGGAEYARLGGLVDEIAWAMASRCIPDRSEMGRGPVSDYHARLEWRDGVGEPGVTRDDRLRERLGWACLVGNDHIRLVAHIYGQAGINGWVHPDDLTWFAHLVDGAYADGILGVDTRGGRYGTWPALAELARSSTTPLMSDHSVNGGWTGKITLARLEARAPRWQPADWGIWADLVRGRKPYAWVDD